MFKLYIPVDIDEVFDNELCFYGEYDTLEQAENAAVDLGYCVSDVWIKLS